MKSSDSFSPLNCSDKLLFVDIPDLVASSIVGGLALAGVQATAVAYGASTYTLTNAMTQARPLGRNGSIAFGWGNALAIGTSTSANVSVFGVGDKVIQRTQTHTFNNGTTESTVSTGFVIAIDHP